MGPGVWLEGKKGEGPSMCFAMTCVERMGRGVFQGKAPVHRRTSTGRQLQPVSAGGGLSQPFGPNDLCMCGTHIYSHPSVCNGRTGESVSVFKLQEKLWKCPRHSATAEPSDLPGFLQESFLFKMKDSVMKMLHFLRSW